MPLPPPPIQGAAEVLAFSIAYAATAELVDELVWVIAEATSKTAKTIVAFAQAVDNGIKGIDDELTEVHRGIAEKAHSAIIEAYETGLKGTPDYRTDPKNARNKRYAGGILGGVIEADGFVTYDARGVYIGNIDEMNAVARQWMRLNYGAGGAAGGGAQTFVVNISDLTTFVLGEEGAARPGFTMPAGRWSGNVFTPNSELGEGDTTNVGQFSKTGAQRRSGGRFASGRKTAVPTVGIKGIHFLAAGLRSVAENIGDAYTSLFKRLWEEGDEAAREALAGTTGIQRPGSPKSVVL